ncbi:uncharacterized protein LOC108115913 [Drosophila eugracilis]|uniref:uncharacterized protein LOC108115913 n=1 Tax=Drosophila eugracilis TaxID=29029 RepID=UPI0007E5F10B|nr:uncharacterized protein LOC108115913 [Drosophila eugracilis]
MDLDIILLANIFFICNANGAMYELAVTDEEIFSSCPDPDPGTLDINGLIDRSELQTSMDADGVTISGNKTMVWDIQPEDRVQLSIKLLYLDRGIWSPTVFSLVTRDFCKSMYDKNQIWYKCWTQHITNDNKHTCINVRGMKFTLETYLLTLRAAATGALREGRYKAKILFQAFDSFNLERPTRICFEIIGDLYLANKA